MAYNLFLSIKFNHGSAFVLISQGVGVKRRAAHVAMQVPWTLLLHQNLI